MRIIRKLRRLTGHNAEKSWQEHRQHGTDARQMSILAELDESHLSFLDIGCNAGLLTAAFAEFGLVALGVEANAEIARDATIRHAGTERVSIIHLEITPQNVHSLPKFDVVACLSVHHQWHVRYGETVALKLLHDVVSLAEKKFFFEVATIRSKYGAMPPEFLEDLDQDSIDRYVNFLFEPLCLKPRFISNSAALGEERFRSLYVIDRINEI